MWNIIILSPTLNKPLYVGRKALEKRFIFVGAYASVCAKKSPSVLYPTDS